VYLQQCRFGFLQSVVIKKLGKNKVFGGIFPEPKTWPLQCRRKLRSWDSGCSQGSHYSISETKNASSNASERESKTPQRFALIFCRSELTALTRIQRGIPFLLPIHSHSIAPASQQAHTTQPLHPGQGTSPQRSSSSHSHPTPPPSSPLV
jgi:hypothetical protein